MTGSKLSARQRHQDRRRRATEARRAAETQSLQRAAAERKPYQLRLRRRRQKLPYALFGAAVVMAGAHVLEHLGAFTIIKPGTDDLLFGWPMASLIALVGAMRLRA